MTMTKLSVFIPTQPTDPGVLRLFAREAIALDAHRLWCGQSLTMETHDVFSYLSGLGYAMRFGSGVELMPLRHPLHAATSGRSTALVSGHDYVMGLGTGSADFRRMVGVDMPSPLGYTREYVTAVKALLRGTHAFGDGSVPAMLQPAPPAAVSVGIGVLGERMARVARDVADSAITWLAPAPYIRDALVPALTRPDGTRPTISAVVHCAVTRGTVDHDRTVLGVVGAHLGAPHYLRMLRQAGIDVVDGDPAHNARAVQREDVFLTGSAERIADGIAQQFAAGVDEVILNVGGVFIADGPGAAVRDLRDIVDAVRAGAAGVQPTSEAALARP